jgi:hypothetical protein
MEQLKRIESLERVPLRKNESLRSHFSRFLRANDIPCVPTLRSGAELGGLSYHDVGHRDWAVDLARKFLDLHNYEGISESVRPSGIPLLHKARPSVTTRLHKARPIVLFHRDNSK